MHCFVSRFFSSNHCKVDVICPFDFLCSDSRTVPFFQSQKPSGPRADMVLPKSLQQKQNILFVDTECTNHFRSQILHLAHVVCSRLQKFPPTGICWKVFLFIFFWPCKQMTYECLYSNVQLAKLLDYLHLSCQHFLHL